MVFYTSNFTFMVMAGDPVFDVREKNKEKLLIFILFKRLSAFGVHSAPSSERAHSLVIVVFLTSRTGSPATIMKNNLIGPLFQTSQYQRCATFTVVIRSI